MRYLVRVFRIIFATDVTLMDYQKVEPSQISCVSLRMMSFSGHVASRSKTQQSDSGGSESIASKETEKSRDYPVFSGKIWWIYHQSYDAKYHWTDKKLV